MKQQSASPPKESPRLPESYYSAAAMAVARFIARPLLHLGYFYRVEGVEHVPLQGPVIVAPNHVSYWDPVIVTHPIKRPVYYLAWKNLFVGFFGKAIRSLGAIPVDTETGADRAAYSAALRLLHGGNCVCIFPEGQRGWDGQLLPLEPGVVRLSLSTGAPIVPFVIHGAFEAWPRWQLLPRLFVPIHALILPPIHPRPAHSPAEKRAEAKRLLRELELALMDGLRRLKRESAPAKSPAPHTARLATPAQTKG